MHKLVWEYHTNNGVDSWDYNIPFESTLNKEDFILSVLTLIEQCDCTQPYACVKDFMGIDYVPVETLQTIEYNVYTLDEWFERFKKTLS